MKPCDFSIIMNKTSAVEMNMQASFFMAVWDRASSGRSVREWRDFEMADAGLHADMKVV